MVDSTTTPVKKRKPITERIHESWLLVYAGLLLLAVATWLAIIDKSSVATVLALLGGGALIAVAFLERLEGTIEMGPVKMTLRAAAIAAIDNAPIESLRAALPLLQAEDVKVAVIRAPRSFNGLRLVDEQLSFIRQQLGIAVLGVRHEDETSWRAGGQVSEETLKIGSELLIAGVPDVVTYFAALASADDERLWERVKP